MRKYLTVIVLVMFVAVSLFAVPVYAEDNVFDKVSDWAATRGKKDPEKSMILAQRKAAREAKKAEKKMQKQAKKMEKGMKNAFGK